MPHPQDPFPDREPRSFPVLVQLDRELLDRLSVYTLEHGLVSNAAAVEAILRAHL